MHTPIPQGRLPAVAALGAMLLALCLPCAARAGDFPALNTPPTGEEHPGKFVWAELFTADSTAATRFYSGVLGWTASTVTRHGMKYVVFLNSGRPVAGLRERDASATKRAARWIPFISVTEMGPVLTRSASAGGEVRAPSRAFPDIGSQAIVTDAEGSPVGIMRSSSGDAPDTEPAAGSWNWFHLISKAPRESADFYRQVFGYEVAQDERSDRTNELLLSSGGMNRGGISVLPEDGSARPGWLGVIRVPNLDDAVSRVTPFGGTVITSPRAAAWGSRFAIIEDPSGGTVGLVEYANSSNPANRP